MIAATMDNGAVTIRAEVCCAMHGHEKLYELRQAMGSLPLGAWAKFGVIETSDQRYIVEYQFGRFDENTIFEHVLELQYICSIISGLD